MLAVAISAVIAGARSFTAIGEWAVELDAAQLTRLGLSRAPEESTLRTLFTRLNAAALDAALAAWAWCRTRQVAGRRVIAIDGKTVGGARMARTAAPHLIAAAEHGTGVVLGQLAVQAKSNEIPAVRDLLASFEPADLAGGDHCRRDAHPARHREGHHRCWRGLRVHGQSQQAAAAGRSQGAALKVLPWAQVPAGARTSQHSHGRRATRTIKVLQLPQLPSWPEFTGATQIAQLRRTVTEAGTKTVEVVYLITSADHRAAPPPVLACWVQGHWTIENKIHC